MTGVPDFYRQRLVETLPGRWHDEARRDGRVWRWRSNDQVPPEDVIEVARELGLITAEEAIASDAERAREMRAFLAEYRRLQSPTPSAEEQFEMRAAFGPGETVIDVLSGRRWTT